MYFNDFSTLYKTRSIVAHVFIPQNAPLTVTYTRPGYSATTDTEEQTKGFSHGNQTRRTSTPRRSARMICHRPLLSIACFLLEKIQ
ncbi:hypothetical protein L208DRAFT_1404578 [Tricholoma matsutake]|nr:hypothetical protein L208DRAFT_1404578 [Tricholoma matsutake 945]